MLKRFVFVVLFLTMFSFPAYSYDPVGVKFCETMYRILVECYRYPNNCYRVTRAVGNVLYDEIPELALTRDGRELVNIIQQTCYLVCTGRYLPSKKETMRECLSGWEQGKRQRGTAY